MNAATRGQCMWPLVAGFLYMLTLSTNGWAVNPRIIFKHLQVQDGLSQSSVFAIAQDDSGFMWFGTRDGLNRYDGIRFRHYRHDPENPGSLAFDDVRAIYVDPLGDALWIGTLDGVSRYNPKADSFRNYLYSGDNTSPSATSVRCILRDVRKRLWIGSDKGIALYDTSRDTFRLVVSGIPGGVNTLFEDRLGRVWAGTDQGLGQVVAEGAGKYALRPRLYFGQAYPRLLDYQITAGVSDASGNIWIGTLQGGLYQWSPATNRVVSFKNNPADPNTLSNDRVRSLSFAPDSSLWVGTFLGLNRLNRQTSTFQVFQSNDLEENSLSHSSIRSVFFDHRGGMWVGTYHGGVNYSAPGLSRFQHVSHLPKRNSISSNVVSAFAEDPKGNMWIGTEGGGLNYWDKTNYSFRVFRVPNSPLEPTYTGNNVKALLLDDRQLWVGYYQHGLYVFNLDSKTFHKPTSPRSAVPAQSLSSPNVYSLLKIKDKLWIATYGGGLNILDLNQNKYHYYRHNPENKQSISADQTRVLYFDHAGSVWLGTEKGLNRIVLDSLTSLPLRIERLLPDVQVYALQEDSKGTIWIGTFSHGLFALHPRTQAIKRFTEADGLPGHTVFGILTDDSGELWLSTNNGLCHFDPVQQTCTNFNYSSGLKNLEFNFNSYFKSRSGTMFFGGINGFTAFLPGDFSPNPVAPPVVFTELEAFNAVVRANDHTQLLQSTIQTTQRVTFRYNEAVFTLRFAALDFVNPSSNRYAYMLEGLDNTWNHRVGQAEANYTIQRAGTYRFRLKAGNSDGVWNPQERVLEIVVLPPPWLSVPAFIAYFVLAGFAILGIFALLRMRHRLQIEQLSKLQQEAINEMKLRFFTNITHEFRTPLTLILGPLDDLIEKYPDSAIELPLQSIRRNAQRLLNLVNQVLNFRKLESDFEKLAVSERDMVQFLREICTSFEETARLRHIHLDFVSTEAALPVWFDSDKMENVVFNLLSNAFKYTPDNGEIQVRLYKKGQSVFFQVKDSGVGIKAEWQEDIFRRFNDKRSVSFANVKSSGIGLAICRQLVELHYGNIQVRSEEGKGATFTVELPLGGSHFTPNEQMLADRVEENAVQAFSYQPDESPVEPDTEQPLPLLLLVDDNPEIVHYVQGVFASNYRIRTAENGKMGWQLARKHAPDLIISDIMMPEMDGIQFCHLIKTTVETSHIPVILLTANSADPTILSGLENGADDYITKPFKPEELRLRVRNILHSRRQYHEKFARVLQLEPGEITVTSADELFLKQALSLIESNMANTDFGVEQFAQALAVSRAVLFTKIKALTNQTPNNFIKTIRLKRAAQMLLQSKIPIAEVGYQVGFPDARYFRKAFFAQFGCNPSEFAEKKAAEKA